MAALLALVFGASSASAAPPYVERRQTLPPVNFAFDLALGIGHYEYNRFNDAVGTGANFELGVGISWSEDEFAALGQNLRNRANRMGEQVELLRRFWKEPFVEFDGKYHKVDGLGLNRQPIDIPVWYGTSAGVRSLRRSSCSRSCALRQASGCAGSA